MEALENGKKICEEKWRLDFTLTDTLAKPVTVISI